MNPFYLLSPGDFIDEQCAHVTFESFAKLYHSVTPKHQRRIKLLLIDESAYFSNHLDHLKQLKIDHAIELIPRDDVPRVEKAYRMASVFLLPTTNSIHQVVPEALSFGLPVLSYENDQISNYIDSTCGMLIRKRNRNQMIEAFCRILGILYFDPEVLKVMQKGAKRKHRNHFSWGVYERRMRVRG